MLPTISKILEKVVHTQRHAYLKNNGILTSKQFGLRPKLSTGTALAHFTDNILQNMDARSFTGAVFLDLSKAFDTGISRSTRPTCRTKRTKSLSRISIPSGLYNYLF